jgi:hypothetical protein
LIEPIDLAAQPVERPKSRRQLTEIETFIFKVAIVVMVIFAILFAANRFVEARVAQGAAVLRENRALLRGGPVFWALVEKKLNSLADEQDIPEEKKQKIIRALEKISNRYQPYINAIVQPRHN